MKGCFKMMISITDRQGIPEVSLCIAELFYWKVGCIGIFLVLCRFLALENVGSGRIMNENFTPLRFSEFSSVDGR